MSEQPFEVVVVGSLNLDLIVRASRLPERGETVLGSTSTTAAGGKGLNQAVAAARQGARTVIIGAVGSDAYGDELVAMAGAEGIDVSAVTRHLHAGTGVAHISVEDSGANTIVVVPRANGTVDTGLVGRHADVIARAAVLLVQLEIPLDGVRTAIELARAAGVAVVLNPAPARPLPHDLLALCDVVVPNESEAALLTGHDTTSEAGATASARALVAMGAGAAIVTLGHRGAVVATAEGASQLVRPFPVAARDSTAAGDAFCGTLAAGL
ncbi:MAG TPA: ribokinase, partial [Acidimicrobiales bacterium]